MIVAAIQMVSCTRLADNLRAAHALLAEAAQGGAELAVLPEYFCVMGQRDTDKLALQEPLGSGPIQDWLAATARALRHRHPFCMALVDLDFFKQINDSFGHAVGDAALRDLAAALRRHTREGDILARFGGEEFVLALPNTDLEGARVLAERIRTYVRGLHWEAEGISFGLTVSIGLSTLDHDGRYQGRPLVDHLLRQADKALYYCKSNGRDQVSTHEDLPERQRAVAGR